MATYATVDDVAAEYDGTIADDQWDYVDRKLTSAELVVDAVAGDIGGRITAGKTTAARVRLVLATMVIRVLRNAGGVRTETVGPFSVTVDQQVSSGRLYVSREDRRLLGLRSAATTMALDDPALRWVHRPPTSQDLPLASASPFVLPPPGGVMVGAVTSRSVVLSWQMVGNAVSYLVSYRIAGVVDEFSPVSAVNGGTPVVTTTTVTGLTPATGYEFRMRAVNRIAQTSDPSAVVTTITTTGS